MQVTVSCPRNRRHVPALRAFARSVLGRLPRDAADDVALALTEACTNVVLHADGARYVVHIGVGTGRCTVEIADDGPGFFAPSTPAGSMATHGRGLGIMRALVDEVELRKDGAGTRVRLVKRWAQQGVVTDPHRNCRSVA